MKPLSTLARGVAAGAAAIIGIATVLVIATPASAVSGRTEVSASTPADLEGFKVVTATCPAGTRVLGGGGTVSGGNGAVHLNHLRPTEGGTGMTAMAYSHGGYRDGELIFATSWSLKAWAICGAGVTGYEIVTREYVTPRGGEPGGTMGTVSVSCPAGKKVIGMGGSIHKSRYMLNMINVNSSLTTVNMRWALALPDAPHPDEYDNLSGWGWAWAICINPVPGQAVVRAWSATDSNDVKYVFAACPRGTTLHSAGGGLNYAARSTKIESLSVSRTLMALRAREMVYGTSESWQAFAVAICAN